MSSKKQFDLEGRFIEYCALIAGIIQELPNTKVGNYIATHLTGASFSSAFNYAEAQAAESRQDFIHKLKVVLKELWESLMALKITYRLKLVESVDPLTRAIQESNELIAIIFKSVETAKRNLENEQ